ncbi:chorismate--pyruvate lyase family protein [Colwellia sp. MEBiC06753]
MLDFSRFFPVTLSAQWQDNTDISMPSVLHSWLYDAGSLTARLKSHFTNFRVEVIGQVEQACLPQDACQHIKVGEPVIVREVLLFCDDKPQVFARSIMPLATLTGDEAKLAGLGNMPLGQAIFNSPYLTRGEFSVAQFDADSTVASLASDLGCVASQSLWGRRSIFFLHDKPLAVAEIFLPDALAYSQSEVTA